MNEATLDNSALLFANKWETPLRHSLLATYSILFCLCFTDIAICLYYLSGLSMDSFETSSVFIGVLVSASVFLLCTVWGCHRTKKARQILPKRSQQNSLLHVSFLGVFSVIIIAFVTLSVTAARFYSLIDKIESEPWGYWGTHPGPEQDMLMNFAVDFNDMWSKGACSGNDCVYADCSGDPVALTPLKCIDDSMDSQFARWIDTFPGSASELSTCISVVSAIMVNSSLSSFPSPTWCQCRPFFLGAAKDSNLIMFVLLVIQACLVTLSVPMAIGHIRMVSKSKSMSAAEWCQDRGWSQGSLTHID